MGRAITAKAKHPACRWARRRYAGTVHRPQPSMDPLLAMGGQGLAGCCLNPLLLKTATTPVSSHAHCPVPRLASPRLAFPTSIASLALTLSRFHVQVRAFVLVPCSSLLLPDTYLAAWSIR